MTRHEYDEAMKEIEWLWADAEKPDSKVRERFLALVVACEAYEKEHFPIAAPTSADIAEYNVDEGRLPCGHLDRASCNAYQCDGSPKLWHEAHHS